MSEIENAMEKPIIGRRPKHKSGLDSAATNSTSMFNHHNRPDISGFKRICSNPLDRLCEILLDWDFPTSMLATMKSKNGGTETNVAYDNLYFNENGFIKLPLTFQNFYEYITMWEPLIIEEMKENVISNYKTKPLHEIKRGYLQFKSIDRLPHVMHTVDAVVIPSSNPVNNTKPNGEQQSTFAGSENEK
jgi:hypothetical protein